MIEKPYYTIGEVSALCGLSTKTLRYYDSIHLVVPEQRNSETNYRYYTKEQLLNIFNIKNLQRFGFSLKEIGDAISSGNPHQIESALEEKLEKIRQQMEELQLLSVEGTCFLQRLKNGVDILDGMCEPSIQHGEVSLVTLPEINLFYKRQLMKNYKNSEINLDRWCEILSEATRWNLTISGSVYVTYDGENPLDKFLLKDNTVEFSVQVEEFGDESEFRKFSCPLALASTHVGPYNTILNTYITMLNWISANNYEICGKCTEEFILSPFDISDDNCHVTRVLIPIKKLDQ